jgi:hypothetical protein
MQSKRIRVFIVILIALFTIPIVTGVVYAAATFESWSGPLFLDPGYQLTTYVSAMSPPDKVVCISYSVGQVEYPELACTCDNPACNNNGEGTWVCEIPSDFYDSTVYWDMSAWTSGGPGICGSMSTQGLTGTFSTGTTAVVLSGLSAAAEKDYSGLLITSGLVLLGLVAGGGALRSRRQ